MLLSRQLLTILPTSLKWVELITGITIMLLLSIRRGLKWLGSLCRPYSSGEVGCRVIDESKLKQKLGRWANVPSREGHERHVVPVGDDYKHHLSRMCPCHPQRMLVSDNTEICYIHNRIGAE